MIYRMLMLASIAGSVAIPLPHVLSPIDELNELDELDEVADDIDRRAAGLHAVLGGSTDDSKIITKATQAAKDVRLRPLALARPGRPPRTVARRPRAGARPPARRAPRARLWAQAFSDERDCAGDRRGPNVSTGVTVLAEGDGGGQECWGEVTCTRE